MARLLLLGYATAGDAADGLLNGLSIESLQRWTLVYLGLSALAFIVVWLVGYLRRPG
ncbi:MAG: cytochrome B6 [Cyanobacteria bacterium M_surface_10_m2_179]|nr:cytochrome B6 [Cyanobacteria bacterium M_surface_10_m2_179]